MEQAIIRLLGGFELLSPTGHGIALPTRKSQALLSILAVSGPRPVPRERLIGLLWSERGEEQARHSLSQALTGLRRALGSQVLVADKHFVALEPSRVMVDTRDAATLLARGDREALGSAATILRGQFLADFTLREASFEDWLAVERNRIVDAAVAGMLRLAGLANAAGDDKCAVAAFTTALAYDRLCEAAHVGLMDLHLRQGRPAEALRQYATASEALRRELDVAPGLELDKAFRVARGTTTPRVVNPHASPEKKVADSWPVTADVTEIEKPSLVVMPFSNTSGDPTQDYFSDGIVEDITIALSRVPSLFVIARNSAFTYKGRVVDAREVGHSLGVRYVLEGSIRRADGQVRIGGSLVDATTGGVIWADRFDGPFSEIFELQDRITERVVGAVLARVEQVEISRATRKRTDSLDAYDFYLHGLRDYHCMAPASLRAAVDVLRRALELDPSYVGAKGLLAAVHGFLFYMRWGAEDDRTISIALAREVAAAATDDSDALFRAGIMLSAMAADYNTAYSTLERALHLNSNSAQALNALGWVHCHSGNPAPAFDLFKRALRLSPLDIEIGYILAGLAMAHLLSDEEAEAVSFAARAVVERPHLLAGHWGLILALTRLGQHEAARAAAVKLLEIRPDFRIATGLPTYSRADFVAEIAAALHAAGLPS